MSVMFQQPLVTTQLALTSAADGLASGALVEYVDQPQLTLRCHPPISLDLHQEIVDNMTTGPAGRTRLDITEVGNWFGETFLEGGLICVAAGTSDAGVFHLWRGTHWEEIADAFVEDDIGQLFRSPGATREIVKLIRRRNWTARSQLDQFGDRLFLRDCVLEFSGGQVITHPHQKSNFNTYFVDLDYDAGKVNHPLWDAYLQRALPDGDGRLLLQEIFGYCLLRNLDYQCFFVLPGPPATGKSTTTDVLNFLIGGRLNPHSGKVVAKFVTSKTLECLGERFGTAGLERALVNISSESTFLTAAAEGVLKKLTGGDPFTVEYKNKDAFTVSCAPKFIVATNEIPRFSDRSDALNQRVIILPFDQQVDLATAQANVAATIFEAESQPILNWAIGGLLRLMSRTGMRRERFTKPAASIIAADDHRRESNPVVDWFEDCLVVTAAGAVSRELAHKDFVAFMSDRGHPRTHPLNQYNHFVKTLFAEMRRRGLPVPPDPRISVGGKQIRIFPGVHLMPTSDFRKGNYPLKSGNDKPEVPTEN